MSCGKAPSIRASSSFRYRREGGGSSADRAKRTNEKGNLETVGSRRSGDRASWQILIIKPTRCTDSSNLFLERNSTCFGQFLCPSSEVFQCTHSNGICHTGLLTACEQDQDGTAVPSWSCSLAVWHIPLLCVQWKTSDDGQRNCPKHVEFNSKNKFEKLVNLVGFIIRTGQQGRYWRFAAGLWTQQPFISTVD